MLPDSGFRGTDKAPSDAGPIRLVEPAEPSGRSPPDKRGVSLVIPAYNEADRIEPTLESYGHVLDSLGLEYEILVVMDGNDETPAVVARQPGNRIRGLRYRTKLGRGGAIFEGLRAAQYSIVGYADADGSIPGDDAARIISVALSGAPVVIASRRVAPESVLVDEPPFRKWVGSVWHLMVRSLLRLRVFDAQCGFKFFHRDVVEMILREVVVANRAFEVAMLLHIAEHGVPIEEVPVHYKHDFRTRMPILKAVPVMFLSLMALFAVHRFGWRRWMPMGLLVDLNRRWASV